MRPPPRRLSARQLRLAVAAFVGMLLVGAVLATSFVLAPPAGAATGATNRAGPAHPDDRRWSAPEPAAPPVYVPPPVAPVAPVAPVPPPPPLPDAIVPEEPAASEARDMAPGERMWRARTPAPAEPEPEPTPWPEPEPEPLQQTEPEPAVPETEPEPEQPRWDPWTTTRLNDVPLALPQQPEERGGIGAGAVFTATGAAEDEDAGDDPGETLRRLRSALKRGSTASDAPPSARELLAAADPHQHWAALRTALHAAEHANATFLELGACGDGDMLALRVAQHLPEATVVAVPAPGAPRRAWLQARDALQLRNAVMAERDPAALAQAAPEELSPVAVQLWSDLSSLAGDLLPHEFERALGALLALSGTTFVASPLPDERFFSYWPSTTELLRAAAASAKLRVAIDTVSATKSAPAPASYTYSYYAAAAAGRSASRLVRVQRQELTWQMVPVPAADSGSGSAASEPELERRLLPSNLRVGGRGVPLGELLAPLRVRADQRAALFTEFLPLAGEPGAAERTRFAGGRLELVLANGTVSRGPASSSSSPCPSSPASPASPASSSGEPEPAKAAEEQKEDEPEPGPEEDVPEPTPVIVEPEPEPEPESPEPESPESPEQDSSTARRPLGYVLRGAQPGAVPFAETDDEPKDQRTPDWASGRHQDAMVEREAALFDRWWPVARRELRDGASLLVLGGDLGLLSVKLARHFPQSVVVSLKRQVDHVGAQLELLELLRVRNNVVCQAPLSASALSSLLAPGDPFGAALLEADALELLLLEHGDEAEGCHAHLAAFEASLGRLLRLARASLLRVPDWDALAAAVAAFRPGCAAAFAERYAPPGSRVDPFVVLLAAAAQSGLAEDAPLELRALPEPGLLRVDVLDADAPATGQDDGVSLYSLLHLGLVPPLKAELFRLFLELPLWHVAEREVDGGNTALAPWAVRFLVLADGSPDLAFVHPASRRRYASRGALGAGDAPLQQGAGDPGRWTVLREQLARSREVSGQFSYLEWSSGSGALARRVAEAFPDATVISVEEDAAAVEAHADGAPPNAIVCRHAVTPALVHKLYESPEFLRYQVLGDSVVDLIATMPDADVGGMLGEMMSSALTTFLQLPSDAAFSLALETFFPPRPISAEVEEVDEYPPVVDGPAFGSGEDFALSAHPRPAYAAMQTRLLAATARTPARGATRVSLRALDGPVPMVRVDMLNMTRHVNHHFDYAKDGHKRKYTMHVVRDDAPLLRGPGPLPAGYHRQGAAHANKVFLTRDHDDAYIPYETLYGVTLISVLRLGLVPELKEAAYRSFVRLPLYEDMAPWNIVFMGPRLDYIDYDTRDKTFDDAVPLAYQIMSVLMNYKRTVEDFGHCGSKAGNPYNFPFVSDCVSSSFKGPCKDPAFPVACGDGQCRSDYPSCLKALVEMEGAGTPLLERLEAEAVEAARREELAGGEWGFGPGGRT